MSALRKQKGADDKRERGGEKGASAAKMKLVRYVTWLAVPLAGDPCPELAWGSCGTPIHSFKLVYTDPLISIMSRRGGTD